MNSRAPGLRARTVRSVRSTLARAVRRSPRIRRIVEKTISELGQALVPLDFYGPGYFSPKGPGVAGQKYSGYADYQRATSNLDVGAYIVFKHLHPDWVLDVGAARGFLLEALSDVGVTAFGLDISHHAVASAGDSVRGRMAVAPATALPIPTGFAPVVTLFETLEHIPPHVVPDALEEIHRISSGFVVATIPSFGPNEHGPDGWFQGKVRWEVLDHYLGLGPEYEGPVPYPDLMRDREGNPIEGHVTIASFSWWTKRFEEAGLLRCGRLEERMNSDLGRYGLLGDQIWNLYAFRNPEIDEPAGHMATSDQLRDAETALELPEPNVQPAG